MGAGAEWEETPWRWAWHLKPPFTQGHQPISEGQFSRQEDWSGLPFPTLGDPPGIAFSCPAGVGRFSFFFFLSFKKTILLRSNILNSLNLLNY